MTDGAELKMEQDQAGQAHWVGDDDLPAGR